MGVAKMSARRGIFVRAKESSSSSNMSDGEMMTLFLYAMSWPTGGAAMLEVAVLALALAAFFSCFSKFKMLSFLTFLLVTGAEDGFSLILPPMLDWSTFAIASKEALKRSAFPGAPARFASSLRVWSSLLGPDFTGATGAAASVAGAAASVAGAAASSARTGVVAMPATNPKAATTEAKEAQDMPVVTSGCSGAAWKGLMSTRWLRKAASRAAAGP
mmetsp:Transcript_89028/g.240649  ORF Transcript_89028/g.240649 Transcript_89028/m.240649 type:complete len:216 (+) Transcript_89028:114-761(+)